MRQVDDGASGSPGHFRYRDPWHLEVEWGADSPAAGFHLAVGIDRTDDVQVVVMSTHHDGLPPFSGRTAYRVRLTVPALPLLSGSFHVQVYLLDEAALHVYDQRKLRNVLTVESDGYRVGLVETEHAWRDDATETPVLAGARAEERG